MRTVKKTTIGLVGKKQLCTCSTLVLYISLPSFCTTTKWNFQKHPGYTFYGGNVVRFLFHFFFSLPHFFTLVAVNISYFPIIIIIYSFTVRFLTCQVIKSAKKFHKNFHVALPTKKCVFCLSSLALVLSLSFFLLSFVGLSPTFSFSLSLSFSVFQNCGHDN